MVEATELFGDDGYYYISGNIEQLSNLVTIAVDVKKPKYSIDKNKHTWMYRTQGFLSWIALNFHRK